MNIYEKLASIQQELHAPKGQRNNFGNYNYRSCEDILEAAKPVLQKHGLVLLLNDDLVNINDRYYIKATARLMDNEGNNIETAALAREAATKKGMDESQITGTASSYARKYALNGLFCIDDSKDADTNEFKNETSNKSANGAICPVCGKKQRDCRKKDGSVKQAEEVIESCGGMCLDCYKAQEKGGANAN